MNAPEEDLVESLLNMGELINQSRGVANVTMLSGSLFLEAAQKIEELTRLGNGLVDVVRSGSDCGWDKAVDAWESATHA